QAVGDLAPGQDMTVDVMGQHDWNTRTGVQQYSRNHMPRVPVPAAERLRQRVLRSFSDTYTALRPDLAQPAAVSVMALGWLDAPPMVDIPVAGRSVGTINLIAAEGSIGWEKAGIPPGLLLFNRIAAG